MSGYRVEYLPAAFTGIAEIFSYVLGSSQSPLTAERYIDRLYERCEHIADAPFGGVSRADLGLDLRMAVFERSIVILYRVEADTILITNIFSGGRDYETLMRDHR
ncbi:type II toxin-antitoxin system RelE/ParE family toxin [Rhizobium metallidurans]|uniref:Toxin ParE1/3/4 n=1 Tax=Rhizobium metallidurans TaxID=1265931 RepID=A0A7W6CXL6_9HYPH|nr:type II toxin-antitoxin system RelE/ParE family toxin [Rhizobium metallidurans]MBB3965570.1 toxin ParE1/3/4 [Rhizobium metallidurans]